MERESQATLILRRANVSRMYPGPFLRVSAWATVLLTMAKRTSKQQTHSWAVYHIRGTPAQFIGIVYDQPNEQAAIDRAIEEFKVPANQRDD
jgi:hypothetical protein